MLTKKSTYFPKIIYKTKQESYRKKCWDQSEKETFATKAATKCLQFQNRKKFQTILLKKLTQSR